MNAMPPRAVARDSRRHCPSLPHQYHTLLANLALTGNSRPHRPIAANRKLHPTAGQIRRRILPALRHISTGR